MSKKNLLIKKREKQINKMLGKIKNRSGYYARSTMSYMRNQCRILQLAGYLDFRSGQFKFLPRTQPSSGETPRYVDGENKWTHGYSVITEHRQGKSRTPWNSKVTAELEAGHIAVNPLNAPSTPWEAVATGNIGEGMSANFYVTKKRSA